MRMYKNNLALFRGKYYTKKALYGRKETDMTGVTKDKTLEEAAMVHGIDVDELMKVIEEL